MIMFCLDQRDVYEAWKRWDREQKARKRAERLALFKGRFGDAWASFRRTHILVQRPSHDVDCFDAKVNGHQLHHNWGKSGSIMVRLLSPVVNLQQRGYLKIDDDGFEEGHTSDDLEWVRLEETHVSCGVTEILYKDPATSACLGCHCRPVCIPVKQF